MNDIIKWKKASRDYIKNIHTTSTQVLIYNPLTKLYHLEYTGPKCIANSKTPYDKLEYFILEEENE